MVHIKTLIQSLIVILGIWALGQFFYRRDPWDLRQGPNHIEEVSVVTNSVSDINLCFIVRTYWAHGASESNAPLTAMLRSFVQSRHKK